MATPTLTSEQQRQLGSISRFMGSNHPLHYKDTSPPDDNGDITHNYTVEGMPNAKVETSAGSYGSTSSTLEVNGNIDRVYHMEGDGVYSEHFTVDKSGETTTSAEIRKGISQPVSDSPEIYRPATQRQMNFHCTTTFTECPVPTSSLGPTKGNTPILKLTEASINDHGSKVVSAPKTAGFKPASG